MDRDQWAEEPEWRELVLVQTIAQVTLCVLELLGRERSKVPPGSDADADLASWRSSLAGHLEELRTIARQVREEHGLEQDSNPDGSKPITDEDLVRRFVRDEPDYRDS